MAAIDKIYIYNYEDFVEFKIWCLMHCKKALPYFYDFFMSYPEWSENKMKQYRNSVSDCASFFTTYKDKNSLYEFYLNSYRSIGDNRSDADIMEQAIEEWDMMTKRKRRFDACARTIVTEEDFSIPVVNLPSRLDRIFIVVLSFGFYKGIPERELWL